MNHFLFIVHKDAAGWFEARARELGNDGPALVMALSATGQAPATHGWCGVALSVAKEAQVQALLDANPERQVDWTRYNLGTQPQWPDQRAAELGLQRISTPFQ